MADDLTNLPKSSVEPSQQGTPFDFPVKSGIKVQFAFGSIFWPVLTAMLTAGVLTAILMRL